MELGLVADREIAAMRADRAVAFEQVHRLRDARAADAEKLGEIAVGDDDTLGPAAMTQRARRCSRRWRALQKDRRMICSMRAWT